MLKLVGSDGKQYYSFELRSGVYMIGRIPPNDIIISNGTVSRKHAKLEIDLESRTCWLSDLGSHNGTLLNGKQVTEKISVQLDDLISFGQAEFKLSEDGDTPPIRSGFQTSQVSEVDLENSVFLDVNEALKPQASKLFEQPEVLSTISDMARMLVLPEPQDIMLQHSLELLSKVIPAQRLAVLFTAGENHEVELAASLLPNNQDPGDFKLSRTIIRDILTNKKAILIGNPTEDPRFAEQQSIISAQLKSAMAVPLFDEEKVHGILYVDTTTPVHKYSDDYLRLMVTFGNIIGSRVMNYSLLQERHDKQVMQAELDRAAGIQEGLLPKQIPAIDGYSLYALQDQCRAVGGDLYDVTTLDDGSVVFMVADVSGKGMGAALLMSNILASFRILYTGTFDLQQAVVRVSNQLVDFSSPENYATLFIGRLDPSTGEVQYVNAGHNPPMLLRNDKKIETLEPTGIIVGALKVDHWDTGRVMLDRGDMIMVFTDGVTEATSTDDRFYGEKRLESCLCQNGSSTAKQVCTNLMQDITGFVGTAPQSDDITMMLLKRN